MVECSFINHVFVGWNLVAFIYQGALGGSGGDRSHLVFDNIHQIIFETTFQIFFKFCTTLHFHKT